MSIEPYEWWDDWNHVNPDDDDDDDDDDFGFWGV
jgi:hypothetical protein